MQFDLYFRRTKVGVVMQTREDFPQMFGTFLVSPSLANSNGPDAASIREYLASRQTGGDTSACGDLAKSSSWSLFDADGAELPILAPSFRGKNEIAWSWNLCKLVDD